MSMTGLMIFTAIVGALFLIALAIGLFYDEFCFMFIKPSNKMWSWGKRYPYGFILDSHIDHTYECLQNHISCFRTEPGEGSQSMKYWKKIPKCITIPGEEITAEDITIVEIENRHKP